jgi:uncharacterized lipoprotein YddW (UPF0748 family)
MHRIALLAALLLTARLGAAEIRAMWVLPWSINTPEKVDAVIASALQAEQTDLMVEVRYRSDALYQTNRVPDAFPNPEPRSYIVEREGFDPLAYALGEGHKQNLRIHAWVVVFNATPLDKELIADNYIYKNHPDWITYDKSGKRMSTSDQYGYFIDPGVPAAREYLLNVFCDLVSGYPELDGLHLDYIRYPNSSLGYHPVSLERFKDSGQEWNRWRISQVSGFVSELRQRTKALNHKLVLSAAVMADYDDAVRYNAQDWLSWLREGIVDYVYPMAYKLDRDDFGKEIDAMAASGLQAGIVVGVRAWNGNGGSMLPKEGTEGYSILDVAERIKLIRDRGFAGISLFSYDGLKMDDAISHLAGIAYAERTIAALAFPERLSPSPEDSLKRGADVMVIPTSTNYVLRLEIPIEGRWFWELKDGDESLLYKRSRYFVQGSNEDYWNGILSDGTRLAPGSYLLCLYKDRDPSEYVIPVQFEGLP